MEPLSFIEKYCFSWRTSRLILFVQLSGIWTNVLHNIYPSDLSVIFDILSVFGLFVLLEFANNRLSVVVIDRSKPETIVTRNFCFCGHRSRGVLRPANVSMTGALLFLFVNIFGPFYCFQICPWPASNLETGVGLCTVNSYLVAIIKHSKGL